MNKIILDLITKNSGSVFIIVAGVLTYAYLQLPEAAQIQRFPYFAGSMAFVGAAKIIGEKWRSAKADKPDG